jgi:hypothetical protein
MPDHDIIDTWEHSASDAAEPSKERYRRLQTRKIAEIEDESSDPVLGMPAGWSGERLASMDETAAMDDQRPETLYYLVKVIDIPIVEVVYVEHRDTGAVKHWIVISERDYDVMDTLYDIELDVRNRFPEVDVKFRVTVASESGPSAIPKTTKIFSRK